MSAPFFSIVTISINQGQFLQKCLESIDSQDFRNFEHIVVDPGSTDGSREMISSANPKIVSLFEPDAGPADGLNRGFELARGRYFLFINADDYLLPGALGLFYDLIRSSNYPELLLCGGLIRDDLLGSYRSFLPGSASFIPHALGVSYLFQQGMVFAASLFRKSGGFNPCNSTSWDGELFFKMLRQSAHHVHRSPRKVGVFRIHCNSITGSQRMSEQYEIDSLRICRDNSPGFLYLSRRVVDRLAKPCRVVLKLLLDPTWCYWKLFYKS